LHRGCRQNTEKLIQLVDSEKDAVAANLEELKHTVVSPIVVSRTMGYALFSLNIAKTAKSMRFLF